MGNYELSIKSQSYIHWEPMHESWRQDVHNSRTLQHHFSDSSKSDGYQRWLSLKHLWRMFYLWLQCLLFRSQHDIILPVTLRVLGIQQCSSDSKSWLLPALQEHEGLRASWLFWRIRSEPGMSLHSPNFSFLKGNTCEFLRNYLFTEAFTRQHCRLLQCNEHIHSCFCLEWQMAHPILYQSVATVL